MYINERGQMNYHEFLRAARSLTGANLQQAAEGICTHSEWSRVEIGDRLPEKMMRDRMLARLGISSEEFEEYLRPEEFVKWECRMYILRCLNNGDVEGVKSGIKEMESLPKHNPVQSQFIDTMRYMLAKMQDVRKETLSMMIELAVAHTIPSIEYAFRGAHLLAPQELNLIAEYANIYEYSGENVREWRFSLYKRILNYIDCSVMDRISRAKVYPRTVWLMCELLLEMDSTEGEIRYAYEMCTKSIELLREANRLYYFVELLECRKQLIERIQSFDDVAIEEKEKLRLVYEKDTQWENLLKELYQLYRLPVYMQNFTYLYVETKAENFAEVLEVRRNMCKLSRVKVSEGFCTDKTIERIEKYMHNPTIVVMRDLLERIGLCGEYRRARIITHTPELLEVNNRFVMHMYNNELDEAEKCLEELESKLDMDICYNQQEVKRNANTIEFRKKELDEGTLHKHAMEALEATIPFENVVCKKDIYFTRSEIECLCNLAFRLKGEVSEICQEILQRLCDKVLEYPFDAVTLAIYEPVMLGFADAWEKKGDKKSSYDYTERLIKECLTHYRSTALVECLYNKSRIYEVLSKPYNLPSKHYFIKKSVEDSLLAAEMSKRTNWPEFLQTKLSDLPDYDEE